MNSLQSLFVGMAGAALLASSSACPARSPGADAGPDSGVENVVDAGCADVTLSVDVCPGAPAEAPCCAPGHALVAVGTRLVADAGCAQQEILGCSTAPGGSAVVVCAKRACDGVAFVFGEPDLEPDHDGGFVDCTDAELAAIQAAPACP